MGEGEDPRAEALARLRHDLRTPLAIVAGFADLLASERPLTLEERREYAERIARAATEIRDLIDAARV